HAISRTKMKWLKLFFGGLLIVLCPLCAHGANGGEEVVVVYNTRVPESKEIAQYYVHKRQVPTNQVFGLDLPTGEEMTRGEYETQLQLPLAKAIKSNRLWHFETELVPATNREPQKVLWKIDESKIRYLALCYGVPLRIGADPTYQDDTTE